MVGICGFRGVLGSFCVVRMWEWLVENWMDGECRKLLLGVDFEIWGCLERI